MTPRSLAMIGGRDHVDVRHLGTDEAGERRADQGSRVHGGGGAVKQDLDFLDRLFGDLTDEAAENLCQLDEGLLRRGGLLGRDGRHVDGVADRALHQIVGHLFRHLDGDVFLGLGG